MNATSGREQAAHARNTPEAGLAAGSFPVSACLPQAIWLTPLAVVAGAVASGGIIFRPDYLLALAMAALLSLAWVGVWSTIAGVNWHAPLVAWQNWTQGAPLGMLPYAKPDSDAAYASQRIGQLVAWLRQELLPCYGNILAFGVTALVVAVVLAAALGSPAVLTAIVAVCFAQIAVIACRGNGHANGIFEGAVVVGLPMLLGAATFAPVALDVLLFSVAAAVASGIRDRASRVRDMGYALATLVAIATRQPVGAFALAVIWAPQLALGLQRSGHGWLAAAISAFAIVRSAVIHSGAAF